MQLQLVTNFVISCMFCLPAFLYCNLLLIIILSSVMVFYYALSSIHHNNNVLNKDSMEINQVKMIVSYLWHCNVNLFAV